MVRPAFCENWQVTSATNNRWCSLACSADGGKLVAVAQYYPWLYGSTNSGLTWFIAGAPSNSWTSVASSADGLKLVASAAVIYNAAAGGAHGGPVYTSRDAGKTWQQTSAPSNQWSCVASSADGATLVAAAAYNYSNSANGQIFVSTNSGTNWSATNAPTNFWYGVACSADGRRLWAAATGGLFSSTNSGATWTSNGVPWDFAVGTAVWTSVALSADGGTVLAIRDTTYHTGGTSARAYYSTNGGDTWRSNNLPGGSGGFVACSADGSRLMVSWGHLYISSNLGGTWFQQTVPGQTYGWGVGCVAASADGGKLFLGLGSDDFGYPNSIYASYALARPRLNLARAGTNVALSWIVPSTNFIVQQSSNLSANYWMPVTNLPTLDTTNLQNRIFMPLPKGNRFYRLATP